MRPFTPFRVGGMDDCCYFRRPRPFTSCPMRRRLSSASTSDFVSWSGSYEFSGGSCPLDLPSCCITLPPWLSLQHSKFNSIATKIQENVSKGLSTVPLTLPRLQAPQGHFHFSKSDYRPEKLVAISYNLQATLTSPLASWRDISFAQA